MKTSTEWVTSVFPITSTDIDTEYIISPTELEMLIVAVQKDAIESAHKLTLQVVHNTFHPEEAA